jgi:hypothetical protein
VLEGEQDTNTDEPFRIAPMGNHSNEDGRGISAARLAKLLHTALLFGNIESFAGIFITFAQGHFLPVTAAKTCLVSSENPALFAQCSSSNLSAEHNLQDIRNGNRLPHRSTPSDCSIRLLVYHFEVPMQTTLPFCTHDISCR